MPTVIDAFVVELGLDPKKFTQGQKDAMAAFKRSSEEARVRASELEENARRQSNIFSKIRREAVGLLAMLAGGYGLKQFIGNLITGDASVGRFARTTGLAVEEVAKFDKALELAGGAPGAGKAALSTLNDQVQAFRAGLGGQILPLYNQMALEGGHIIDINKTIVEQFLAIAKNARVIEAKTPGRGGFFLRQLGLGEDAINVLIRGDAYLQSVLDKSQKLGAANKEAAAGAENLLEKWRTTAQLVQGLIRPLTAIAADVLDKVNAALTKASENQKKFYDAPAADRPALKNERINRALGVSREQHEKAQEWFAQSWLGRLIGVKPDSPGRIGTPVPVQGGIFGGMNFKPLGWPDLPPAGGPASAAQADGAGGRGGSTSEINVNGPINVYTQATDAQGVASGLKSALENLAEKRRLATQANTGQE